MDASLLRLPRGDGVSNRESGPLGTQRHQCAKVEVCVSSTLGQGGLS